MSLLYDRMGATMNGRSVKFRRLPEPIGDFVYEGRVDDGELHFWTELGYWRESMAPHPLDLILPMAKGVAA
jgi:hypothetical protein